MTNVFRIAILCAAAVAVTIHGPVAAGKAEDEAKPNAIKRLAAMQESLRQTRSAKNPSGYLQTAITLRDFLNGSPNAVLQLALAQLLADKNDDAMQSFAQYVHMGQSNEAVLGSKQFEALRAMPQYSKLHADMAANDLSQSTATKVFGLADAGLLPEDIDYDATAKRFYITSVLKKEILAVDSAGNAHVFATGPSQWPMMALKVDQKRRLLWATEVAVDGFSWSPKEEWGRSAVLLYDLKSGKLLWRAEGPAHTALGDMTLTAEGDAIVSDGDGGGVYRVRRATQKIERLDEGEFISPQTPAILPGGERILIPDYVRGIGILNIQTKQVIWISADDRYALSGIDGLYLSGRTLIATQNGASPVRVVRFELDSSLTRVKSQSLLERATPALGDPTHGVVVDGHFYYLANSGWDKLDEQGNVKAGMTMSEALIMRADLN